MAGLYRNIYIRSGFEFELNAMIKKRECLTKLCR